MSDEGNIAVNAVFTDLVAQEFDLCVGYAWRTLSLPDRTGAQRE